MIATPADFARLPGLRLERDAEGPIAVPAPGDSRTSRDYLYLAAPGVLGIFLERLSPRTARSARFEYLCAIEACGGRVVDGGAACECYSTIHFKPGPGERVPAMFLAAVPQAVAT